MEITILDNGVVFFDEKSFVGGISKAKHLKHGGLLKMLSEANRLRKC